MSLPLLGLVSEVIAATANRPLRVMIAPVRFHAVQDLDYLNRGIAEMLATRLPVPGEIEVLRGGEVPADDGQALAAARSRRADYILTGGITILDQQISTDLRLLDVRSGMLVLPFSRFGQGPGDLLVHVEDLAIEVAELLAAAPPA